jgi:hypothetical protein
MKKHFRIIMFLATLFAFVLVLPVRAQDIPPPPPAHSQNGNQGTGCPIDRTHEIILALAFSVGYGVFALYLRGRKKKKVED